MPTSPPADFTPTTWSNHPGYDLTKYTLLCRMVNDLDKHHPGTVDATVQAVKFKGQTASFVRFDLDAGPASMNVRMSAGNARSLGNALLEAANIVEKFEAEQILQKEDAELARYNAGPLTTRVDIADGQPDAIKPPSTDGSITMTQYEPRLAASVVRDAIGFIDGFRDDPAQEGISIKLEMLEQLEGILKGGAA